MNAIVILAGGESRRMGKDKVFLGYQNTSFLEYLVSRASAVFDRVLISAGTEEHGALIAQRLTVPLRPEIITDTIPGLGPLGGLMSVFEQTDLERFAVTAADMPDADMQVLASLLERLEQEYAARNNPEPGSAGQKSSVTDSCVLSKPAVMLRLHPDYPEPCAAAYDRSSYPIMKAACEKGTRSIVKTFGPGRIEMITAEELKRTGSAFTEPDLAHAFRNINTPDDYRSLST